MLFSYWKSPHTCLLFTLKKKWNSAFLPAAKHCVPPVNNFVSVQMKLINFHLSMTALLSLSWADGVSWSRNSLLKIYHCDNRPAAIWPAGVQFTLHFCRLFLQDPYTVKPRFIAFVRGLKKKRWIWENDKCWSPYKINKNDQLCVYVFSKSKNVHK
jgi:hypothetical protein